MQQTPLPPEKEEPVPVPVVESGLRGFVVTCRSCSSTDTRIHVGELQCAIVCLRCEEAQAL